MLCLFEVFAINVWSPSSRFGAAYVVTNQRVKHRPGASYSILLTPSRSRVLQRRKAVVDTRAG